MTSARGRRRRARPLFALVAIAAIAVAAAACDSSGGSDVKTRLQADYEAVIKTVLPSVVEISASDQEGSGVVYDAHGDIVTNAHVVGKAKAFEIRVSAVSTPIKARLVGVFTPDDLAVIKVEKDARYLKAARWADSSKVQVGQIVLAMGSPYGLIDSVTQGIVSATGRVVTGPAEQGQPPSAISNAIQTSAAINPGNSGGALALLSGYVLGIPTLTAKDPQLGASAQGIGFAIPANVVRDIAGQLIRTGKVARSDRASLDITGRTHTDSTGTPDGVTVDVAKPGGAAAKAGIRPGDVVAGVAGEQTASLDELENVLIGFTPGTRVQVEILRDGNPRQVTVTLGSLSS